MPWITEALMKMMLWRPSLREQKEREADELNEHKREANAVIEALKSELFLAERDARRL